MLGLAATVAAAGSALAAERDAHALTPAAYRTRAAAMCRAEKKALDALQRSVPRTAAGLRKLISGSLVIARQRVADIQRLDPPSPFRARHRRLISLNREGVSLLTKFQAQVKSGVDPVTAYQAFDAKFGKLDKAESAVWSELGVEECASGFGSSGG